MFMAYVSFVLLEINKHIYAFKQEWGMLAFQSLLHYTCHESYSSQHMMMIDVKICGSATCWKANFRDELGLEIENKYAMPLLQEGGIFGTDVSTA